MKNKWLLFSYSLPSSNAKARMRIWRRIAASGAVQVKTGLHILPNRQELAENISWLLEEVNSLGGEALAIQCAEIEGLEDERIESLFQAQVDQEFMRIQTEARTLLEAMRACEDQEQVRESLATLRKLRKRSEALQALDFFPSGVGGKTSVLLEVLAENIHHHSQEKTRQVVLDRSAYQNRIWVTRSRPYVDRLSSAWLIDRFIDAGAEFRFLPPEKMRKHDAPKEVLFDVQGGEFTHQDGLITFEVLTQRFGLRQAAIIKIGELIRVIDVQEELSLPDDAGLLKSIIDGLSACADDDQQLLERALLLFDALYAAFSRTNK